MTAPTDLSQLRPGTAPDSWGVCSPEDPHQVTWQQYLDELPKAGSVRTELGPFGFLPNNPPRLRDGLEQRGLMLCGGTMFAALHHGAEALKKSIVGAMVEPSHREPAMPPLLDALAELDKGLFCMIEQDLYPVEPDVPLPIAARTAGYFVACGLGPVRRWPYVTA